MNHFRWFKTLSWMLSAVSCFVMISSPLALAKESQNNKMIAMKSLLEYAGLNGKKKITYGEFWNKVKDNFSPELQQKFYPTILANKDELLPDVQVSEVKTSKGGSIPRMTFSEGGQTYSVEIPMDGKAIVKFNGTAIPLVQTVGALEAALSQVPQDKIMAAENAKMQKFFQNGKFRPTFKQWTVMTPWQRAYYMSQVRLLMDSVQDVLAGGKAKKTSDYQYNKYEFFFVTLFGENAYAGPGGKGNLDESNYAVGDGCIVAGYPDGKIKVQNKTPFCTLNPSGSLDQKYTSGCSTGQIRCNPIMYGYSRNSQSSSICLNYKLGDSQTTTASHRGGVCETASPLTGKAEETQAFIKSILAQEKNVSEDEFARLFNIKDGKVFAKDEAAYNQYIDDIMKKFEAEQQKANEVCLKIEADPNKYQAEGSSSQTEACKALRERMANVRVALESVCFNGAACDSNRPAPVANTGCDPKAADYKQGGTVGTSGKCECLPPTAFEIPGRDGAAGACSDKQCDSPKYDGEKLTCANDVRRDEPTKPEPKKKKGISFGGILKGLLIATVVGGLIECATNLLGTGLCRSKKKNRNVYVPPVPVTPDNPTTPIDPDPVDPTPPTEIPTTSEGGTGVSPITGGGTSAR